MQRVLKAASLYFAVVFAIGFMLGTIRTLWLVPRVGVRVAELIEMPIMLAAAALTAQAIVHRRPDLNRSADWAGVGLVALALLLLVEFTAVLRLRSLSLADYFASRDPVSSTVYVLALAGFAALPLLLFRRGRRLGAAA